MIYPQVAGIEHFEPRRGDRASAAAATFRGSGDG